MVQQVKDNGKIYHFPDDATPKEMESAILREKGADQLKFITENAFPSKQLTTATKDIGKLASGIAGTVSEGVPALLGQASNDPARAMRNTAAGLAGIPANIANTALNIPSWLTHLFSDTAAEKVKKYTPQIPVEEAQNYMVGGENVAEDQPIRNLAGLLPIAPPVAKVAGKVAGPVARIASEQIIGKSPTLERAKIESLRNQRPGKAAEIEQAKSDLELAKEAHEKSVSEAEENLRMANANKMKFEIKDRTQKIDQATQESERLKQELESMPPMPQEPVFGQEHIHNAEMAAQEAQRHGENVNAAEQHHAQTQNLAQEAEGAIGQHLNLGATHSVEAANSLKHRGESTEKFWEDSYKDFLNQIKDENFQIPDYAMTNLAPNMSPTELVKTYGADAFAAIKKGKMDEFIQKQREKEHPENPYFKKLMEMAPTIKDTNAHDFLLKRKAFRDATYKLKKKIYEGKFDALEEDKAREATAEADKIKSQIEKTLEEGLGKHKETFDWLNKGYSEQVHPLRDNPIMQGAKEGKLSDNIMKAMRTNEPGMDLVRQFVKEDPQLLRNIIGQRYAVKPGEVHYPNALMREYLNESPELQRLVEHRNVSHRISERAKGHVVLAKQKHIEARKKFIQAEKEHNRIESEKNKQIKSYEKETKEHVDTKEKLQSQIDKHENEIKEHDKRIELLEKHRKDIIEKKQAKNIALKEKVRLENDFKKINQEINDTKKQKYQSTTRLRKLFKLGKGVYRMAKISARGF